MAMRLQVLTLHVLRPSRMLAPLIAAWLLCSCASSPVEKLENWRKPDPTAPYLGRSEAEIIACAGQPFGRYQTATGENLVYHYNGAGPVPSAGKEKGGKDKKQGGGLGLNKKDKNWACTASFAFTGGKLTSIQYAPRKAESPYTENGRKKPNLPTCSFTLPNCPPG
jgi:hypothetical protein